MTLAAATWAQVAATTVAVLGGTLLALWVAQRGNLEIDRDRVKLLVTGVAVAAAMGIALRAIT